MGRYININLNFKFGQPFRSMLQPLFSTSLFTPVAIVGSSRNNLLITGYALEVFEEEFINAKTPPESIEIVSEEQDSEHIYLQRLADNLTNLKTSSEKTSPFEKSDSALRITFVETCLKVGVFEKLDVWMRRYPSNRVEIYGSIPIHAQQGDPLNFAYRPYLSDDLSDTPFLELLVTKHPRTDAYSLSLYSTSSIWLHDSKSETGNLKVETLDADKNLNNLVNLTKLIAQTNSSHFTSIFIDLEGHFRNESPRILKAFYDTGLTLST